METSNTTTDWYVLYEGRNHLIERRCEMCFVATKAVGRTQLCAIQTHSYEGGQPGSTSLEALGSSACLTFICARGLLQHHGLKSDVSPVYCDTSEMTPEAPTKSRSCQLLE